MGLDVLMAPGPGGTLFVLIPTPGGSVLALLDRTGTPRRGWPIAFTDSTSCRLLFPLEDGSVRVVCDPPGPQTEPAHVPAFAFDSAGRSMAGWPVQLRPGYWNAGRVVGDELTLVTDARVPVTTVAADGTLRSGTDVEACCGEWAVGPDGIVYGARSVSGGTEGSAEVSQITALDLSGVRAGWPVKMDGIASGPAFGPGGRIVLTVGSFVRATSRVLVFDRNGKAVSAVSAELPIATAQSGADCIAGSPEPPLVAQDGTIFVFSEIDDAIYGLDSSLKVMSGWPIVAGRLERPWEPDPEDELFCPPLGLPVVGPDSTLYLPLQTRDATVGGSIVAVGPDGRVRAGWPVELRRPGSEFWSVVVGSDGTVYALAIELESSDSSSATILAIAPDSTVLWTTTVVEP
jgi:hypothetical protein